MPVPESPESAEARGAYSLEIEEGIATLYRASKARAKSLLARFDPDLPMAGYLVLRYVMAHEPVRAGGISVALDMDKSAVSRQISMLRESGLLLSQPDPDDGRASLLISSDSAKTALESFRADLKSDYQRILESWDTDEIHTFAALLAKFNARF
ncbi:MAG: MarR family transcriptional regulator [Microbacteriaceae bacterium]|jgi:DNA-binding MarR family transcriptional regulator|nr:MarR family transcriptional regulator [Microbacteriaceae bacterium]